MSRKFINGVTFYTIGQAIVPVSFPEDDVCCKWCPFCKAERDIDRFWCKLTEKIIYNPFSEELPDHCLIKF